MKGLRFLLLGLVICLASGVKAQFYDGPDDIYYYVEEYYEYEETRQIYWQGVPTARFEKTGKIKKQKPEENEAIVRIFNFDGEKAAELTDIWAWRVKDIKRQLQDNPNRYEDSVENTDYKLRYVSSSYNSITYKNNSYNHTYTFSSDRSTLVLPNGSASGSYHFKRVDKSYFKVGRSRTPSGTMHE